MSTGDPSSFWEMESSVSAILEPVITRTENRESNKEMLDAQKDNIIYIKRGRVHPTRLSSAPVLHTDSAPEPGKVERSEVHDDRDESLKSNEQSEETYVPTIALRKGAFKEKNGQDLLGRPVKLDIAAERRSYTPHSNGGAGPHGTTVYVRGFDTSGDENGIKEALKAHFSACGEVTRVSLPRDDHGLKGFAYVDFANNDAVSNAMLLNKSELKGLSLVVEEAKPRFRDGTSGGRFSGGWGGGNDSGGRFGGGRFGDHAGGGRFGDHAGGGRFGGRFGDRSHFGGRFGDRSHFGGRGGGGAGAGDHFGGRGRGRWTPS